MICKTNTLFIIIYQLLKFQPNIFICASFFIRKSCQLRKVISMAKFFNQCKTYYKINDNNASYSETKWCMDGQWNNAPATFQWLINQLAWDLEGCEGYLDDIAIYSKTWQQHLECTLSLFNRLTQANLIVNLTKSEFEHSHNFFPWACPRRDYSSDG